MSQSNRKSVWTAICSSVRSSDRFLAGKDALVRLSSLADGSSLGLDLELLRGRSVLIFAESQAAGALAMIELDGIARQLVLCPPDLSPEQLPFIVDTLQVNAVLSDKSDGAGLVPFSRCGSEIHPANFDRTPSHQTEWVLLTSGTTGRPKMVVHSLSTLAGGIQDTGALAGRVWSTFYDIRRYGGLQIFLRAVLTGGSLVLSDANETPADFLSRVARFNVSHISGTPSHWRKAIMSSAATTIAPDYVRLSGEIADQAILNNLRAVYPKAKIAHAFASTEAGLAFDVDDGLAGFPASLVEQGHRDVELKIESGSLRIRSPRTAIRYITQSGAALADADGFVDTGDIVELRGDRYYFMGRRDGMINVGGLKVHPEEVEAVINRHPQVRVSIVRTRKNPITGSVVVADVVLKTQAEQGLARKLEQEILQLCQQTLPRHKVPAAISILTDVSVAATGKLVRRHA